MNFSSSNIWNNSLYIRYPINKIIKLGELYFYENDNLLICQNFFEPHIGEKELNELKKIILNSRKVMFKYINNSKDLDNLKKLVTDNNFVIETIDSWEAPQLILNGDLSDYLSNKCGLQIKNNYKRYQKMRGRYKFYNSKYHDVLKLWNYVLEIDFNSWKKDEQSDMKSLNREDLQYLPFLLLEKDKSNLVVICDSNDKPLAYSLMFKDDNDFWYAVKWGASHLGRNMYAGFACLFNHLEYLYSINNKLLVDFWGRRNKTYDLLKNITVIRNHIQIYKKED